ncbi:MAG: hypothetical protein RML95_11020 [Anaerolineae bacterium]|nr:hypothetical protein [Anaerolineae bacterium]MDW8299854.1 hypothetical protein [Anaerolineae bacterium]
MHRYSYALLVFLMLVNGLHPLQDQADRDDILFASERDGNREIYVMRPDGSNVRRLTYHPAEDDSPSWSPDKTRIAFTSRRNGNFDIYVMDANGQNIRQITYNHGTFNDSPTWSPDGSQVAFISNKSGTAEIFVVNANGGTPRQVTRSALGTQSEALTPAWAPDGGRFAYVSNQGSAALTLRIVDLNGVELFQYRDMPQDAEAVSPAWSGDGRLAFGVNGGGYADIIVLDANNLSSSRLITSINNARLRALSWSPDGQQLVYVSVYRREATVGVIDVSRQSVRQLLSNESISAVSWGAPSHAILAQADAGSSGNDRGDGIGAARTLPPLNQRTVAPPGAVRLNNGKGMGNGARQDDGNFQVENYCRDLWHDNFDWFCGSRRLDAGDFDAICQRTYNNPNAFAIRDGNNRIVAFNWRCYAFPAQAAANEGAGAVRTPPPLNQRTVAPPGAVRLNNGRGMGNGARQDDGNFQVENYCRDLWRDNFDWFCGSRRLDAGDFDAICQRTYNNPNAFAIRDGKNRIVAFNWRCYAFPAQTAATPAAVTGERLCSNSPPPRLRIGDVGYVVYGYGPVNLNRYPRRSRNNNVVVDVVSEGSTFTVIDGPVCGDGLTWWRVRRTKNNFVGWMAEGRGNIYWLDRR